MRKLREAQRRVLQKIAAGHSFQSISFRTGDSLRKLGLVERETLFVVKRVYARSDGEHLQFDTPDASVPWHDWFITPAGRAALEASNAQ